MFKKKKPTPTNIEKYIKHVSIFKNGVFELVCFFVNNEYSFPSLHYDFRHMKKNGDYINIPVIRPSVVEDYNGINRCADIRFYSDKELQDWLDSDTERYKDFIK